MSEETKRCSRCKHTKPLEDFAASKATSDGRQRWCRRCMKAYGANYRKHRPKPRRVW